MHLLSQFSLFASSFLPRVIFVTCYQFINMTDNFLDELSDDFGKLLFSQSDYDVIIEAGENGNTKKFYVHSLILSLRSCYFKVALSDTWARKKDEKIIFKKPNIEPKIMKLLLK
jgi:hypothetical protein